MSVRPSDKTTVHEGSNNQIDFTQGTPNISTPAPEPRVPTKKADSFDKAQAKSEAPANNATYNRAARFAGNASQVSGKNLDGVKEVDTRTYSVTDVFAGLMSMATDRIKGVDVEMPASEASPAALNNLMATAGLVASAAGADGTDADVSFVSTFNKLTGQS